MRQFNLEEKDSPSILKDYFSSNQNHSFSHHQHQSYSPGKTKQAVFLALKSPTHFLPPPPPQSMVPRRSDLSSEAISNQMPDNTYSSTISIDTQMMYSRSLIYSSKKCRTRTASLRNTSINWIFLERLLIQIISKPFITKKIQNKAKHLTRNAIKGTSIKKKSMSNSFESLRYIKCYSLSSPNL